MVSNQLDTFEDTLIAFFTQAGDLLGVPRSVSLIYGTIFASPEPLTFADIEARQQLSKGSISQGLRLLKEMGAIRPVATPSADRRERYEPDLDLRHLVERLIQEKIQPQLTQGTQRLALLRQTLETTHSVLPNNGLETLRTRVTQLEKWHTRTQSLLPLVQTLLKLRK